MKRVPWTREEIIIAYALYCVTPLNKIRTNNPIIQRAAERVNHSVSSLCMRMNNFMAIDPDSAKDGCAHTAKMDREIYDEFKHDWFTLSCKAEEYLGFELFPSDEATPPPDFQSMEASPFRHSRSAAARTKSAAYSGLNCLRLMTANAV